MKAMIRKVNDNGKQYECLAFVCPGCVSMKEGGSGLHMLPVNTTVKKPSWKWNQDLILVTLEPSILTSYNYNNVPGVCHSFLRDGVFEFLADCTHELVGKKVPLPDLPDWVVNEQGDSGNRG